MGGGEVVLVTTQGQAISFAEEEIRPIGLNAGGVRGISLGERDAVAGMDMVSPRSDVLVFSENGYAKRATLAQYPAQGRAGKGVVSAKAGATSGPLVGAAIVQAETQLVVVTNKGKAKLIRAKTAPSRNRDGRMDQVFALSQGDSVATLVMPTPRAEMEAPAEPGSEAQAATVPEVEPEVEIEEEPAEEKKTSRKARAASGKGKAKPKGKTKAVQLALGE